MRLGEWLILACVTIYAIVNGFDYFEGKPNRRNLFLYGAVTFIFSSLFLVADQLVATAYCIFLAVGQLTLAWNLRKKADK
jgi:hypothetical protein